MVREAVSGKIRSTELISGRIIKNKQDTFYAKGVLLVFLAR